MKTIAVLTMVFLPGTFVSAVLGMNFFQSSSGHFHVDPKWWIFPAVAVPLPFLWWACGSAGISGRNGGTVKNITATMERNLTA
jgi:hypothetical protein